MIGVWSLFAVEIGDYDTGYLTALLVKLLPVGVPGVAAAVHATTRSGPLGSLAALVALFAGMVLVT